MHNLFRFVALRPPEPLAEGDAIRLQSSEALHAQLRQARASDAPAAALKAAGEAVVSGAAFVGAPSNLAFNTQLSALRARLGDVGAGELRDVVTQVFGEDAGAVTAGDAFRADKVRLQDSLVALKLLSDPPVPVEPLILFVRLIDLVERVAAGDPTLAAQGAVERALSRPIVLPSDLLPLPPPVEEQRQSSPSSPEETQAGSAVVERAAALEGALRDLASVDRSKFERADPAARSQSRAAHLAGQVHDVSWLYGPVRMETRTALTSQRLTRAAVEDLPTATRAAVDHLGVDLLKDDVPLAMERIREELASTAPQVMEMKVLQPAKEGMVGVLGDAFFPMHDLMGFWGAGGPFGVVDPVLPTTHGKIQPVGVADLLVVRYHPMRYELGEIAYIENILKGESYKREVSRSETTEETTVLETEQTKEEERDLQATERFELASETQNTLQMDGKLQSGFTLSPAYGPVLQFQNNNNNPVGGSQTVSERQSSRYARDVTTRSATRVSERVRRQVTQRMLREFTEKTEHGFENVDGAGGNVAGIYQWVEKIYNAQVFNYGQRLFYDMIVPEPAAFLIMATASRVAEGHELVKPHPFTLTVKDVQDYNYAAYAQQYGATNLEPPPPASKWISQTFAEADGSQFIAKTHEMTFSGYAATGYRFRTSLLRPLSQTNPAVLFVTLGVADTSKNEPLQGEVDSISIGITATNVTHVILAIDLYCERTESLYEAWQAKTHAAIAAAQQRQQADYEERLANSQASLRVQMMGQSPDRNREVERTELKRSCISLITYQHYDAFDALEFGGFDPDTGAPLDLPQVKLGVAESQGRYVRFFEQAFEWEQVVYQFYPYFWDRKEQWVAKVNLHDPDAQFADFLAAGWGRVLVPARPGFEAALSHFMETGEIPEDDQLGDLHSDLYLPIVEEIKAKDGTLDDGVPYGDSWEVRLPTTLVMLRGDAKLPKWKATKDAKGATTWVPDEA